MKDLNQDGKQMKPTHLKRGKVQDRNYFAFMYWC